jgi:hypothetical protein
MLRPRTIDLSALTTEIASAASHLAQDDKVKPEITFLHNPGIIGFVAPSKQLADLELSKVSAVAEGVKAKAGPLAGPASVVIHDGHVIIGFLINELLNSLD